MPADNPLIQAMQARKAGPPGLSDPKALLEFILEHFTLAPRASGPPPDQIVTTQESHAP